MGSSSESEAIAAAGLELPRRRALVMRCRTGDSSRCAVELRPAPEACPGVLWRRPFRGCERGESSLGNRGATGGSEARPLTGAGSGETSVGMRNPPASIASQLPDYAATG